MSKRVTYRKVTEAVDYVDARFDVLLDGEVIGQVIRNRETRDVGRQQHMTATMSTATIWQAEGVRYAGEYRTRVDAAIDLLQARGMSYAEAREVAGKRGF